MATPEKNMEPPIPITRAREVTGSGSTLERRTDALRLELAAQLARAEEAERRFQKSLLRTHEELVSLSEDVRSTLRKLTQAEQMLKEKQKRLKQLLAQMATLDRERQTATGAKHALEALQFQYDQYNRARAERDHDHTAVTQATTRIVRPA